MFFTRPAKTLKKDEACSVFTSHGKVFLKPTHVSLYHLTRAHSEWAQFRSWTVFLQVWASFLVSSPFLSWIMNEPCELLERTDCCHLLLDQWGWLHAVKPKWKELRLLAVFFCCCCSVLLHPFLTDQQSVAWSCTMLSLCSLGFGADATFTGQVKFNCPQDDYEQIVHSTTPFA